MQVFVTIIPDIYLLKQCLLIFGISSAAEPSTSLSSWLQKEQKYILSWDCSDDANHRMMTEWEWKCFPLLYTKGTKVNKDLLLYMCIPPHFQPHQLNYLHVTQCMSFETCKYIRQPIGIMHSFSAILWMHHPFLFLISPSQLKRYCYHRQVAHVTLWLKLNKHQLSNERNKTLLIKVKKCWTQKKRWGKVHKEWSLKQAASLVSLVISKITYKCTTLHLSQHLNPPTHAPDTIQKRKDNPKKKRLPLN